MANPVLHTPATATSGTSTVTVNSTTSITIPLLRIKIIEKRSEYLLSDWNPTKHLVGPISFNAFNGG